mmetsp:Transcript_35119/g.76887  ORF Transcript_35119/g.76887 Transcript_35119/m.76887 type:complete len:143 (-) Transcript_35119:390-818(-)
MGDKYSGGAQAPQVDGWDKQQEVDKEGKRYKMCRVLCDKSHGWTVRTFCGSVPRATCHPEYRPAGWGGGAAYQVRCLSLTKNFVERSYLDTPIRKASVFPPSAKDKADDETKQFCFERCSDEDQALTWTMQDIAEYCRAKSY